MKGKKKKHETKWRQVLLKKIHDRSYCEVSVYTTENSKDGGVPQVRTRNPKPKQVHSEPAHAQKIVVPKLYTV
jgi:hypothetical protein